jgi:hypothetical protein
MTADINLEKLPDHGWQARSVFHLGIKIDDKTLVLDITSNKPKKGGIASGALVYHMDAQGELEHHIGQDYSKLIMYDPKARCTQKNLLEQHSGVLKILHLLMAEAMAVYAPQTGAQD